MKYSIIWFFIGPLVLFYTAIQDTIVFFKILLIKKSDNKVEEAVGEVTENPKDNMVVFNEILNTMKAILSFVIKSNNHNSAGNKDIRRRPGLINLNNFMEKQINNENSSGKEEFDLGDPNSEFIIRKDLLINAWK